MHLFLLTEPHKFIKANLHRKLSEFMKIGYGSLTVEITAVFIGRLCSLVYLSTQTAHRQ